jgi:hypothetical protein
MNSREAESQGIVRDWETFGVDQLAARLSITAAEVRGLLRKGLRFRRVRKRIVISGSDFREFIEQGDQRCQNDDV